MTKPAHPIDTDCDCPTCRGAMDFARNMQATQLVEEIYEQLTADGDPRTFREFLPGGALADTPPDVIADYKHRVARFILESYQEAAVYDLLDALEENEHHELYCAASLTVIWEMRDEGHIVKRDERLP